MRIVKETEKYLPKTAEDSKDQAAVTAAFDRWNVRNYQALGEIILMLKKELSRSVRHFELATEV